MSGSQTPPDDNDNNMSRDQGSNREPGSPQQKSVPGY